MSINQISGANKAAAGVDAPHELNRNAKEPSLPAAAPVSVPEDAVAGGVSAVDLKNSVAAINHFIKASSNVQFSIDHDSGKFLIKIIDTETNTVLRQLPSAEVLAIAKDLGKLQGILIKGQA